MNNFNYEANNDKSLTNQTLMQYTLEKDPVGPVVSCFRDVEILDKSYFRYK